jgi:hypothetical protein
MSLRLGWTWLPSDGRLFHNPAKVRVADTRPPPAERLTAKVGGHEVVARFSARPPTIQSSQRITWEQGLCRMRLIGL